MGYSCSDFTDSILNALGVDTEGLWDDPSGQAEVALAEIKRLQGRDRMMAQPADSKLEHIQLARALVREARLHLRDAGANNAADYVQRALKSVEGAERHARGMATRQNGATP